ncbi:MAG: histidyl-tRNA synthase [Bacteroides sp. SM23_62]|nr:MAG: histidyl-tRNA synthase [Bacteroides sp. SM23_62]
MKKVNIPKGTRDYSPDAMARRRYIFSTIEDVFRLYGYQPIETPAMENLDTLLGKYGEEGDKLLFRILNSGDFLSGVGDDQLHRENIARLSTQISEKGLRYDLTVPFARYVVQHRNEINFPFKRYQIQPVWRADRPQKGRYREFYQCDVDIIGSRSLLNEFELTEIIDKVFERFGMNIDIRINNRKILAGIAEVIGEGDRLTDITAALDKIDRIGADKVNEELRSRGLSAGAVKKLQPIIQLSGDHTRKLEHLGRILSGSETGIRGVNEMSTLFGYLESQDLKASVELDLTLARGLDYYTGAIIEVLSTDVQIGSVCGGGRYDDLTGIFGLEDVSGVGVSFGADRIYDVLQQLDLFPKKVITGTRVLFINFGTAEEKYILSLLPAFRKAGIETEIYPEQAKLKKQMSYANGKGIPHVALAGAHEISRNILTIKDMETGRQQELTTDQAIRHVLESKDA